MAVKAVFFDIDGTLLTDKRTVAVSTIHAISQLKKRGYLIGLATGRGPQFSLPYMASLQMDLAVCYNGQYIIARDGWTATQPLSEKDLRALIKYSISKRRDLSFGKARDITGSGLLHVGMGMSRFLYWLVKRLPHFMVRFLTAGVNQIYRRLKPPTEASLLANLTEPVYQVVMLAGKQEIDHLEKQFPHLTFTRSSPFAADIISRGMSKLRGIAIAGKHYGFDLTQVMAFGDSDNDVEMLSGSGYGVAMGNAGHWVRQTADYITASNNQDGIAAALKHYGLIER